MVTITLFTPHFREESNQATRQEDTMKTIQTVPTASGMCVYICPLSVCLFWGWIRVMGPRASCNIEL